MTQPPARVLVVEDNLLDLELLTAAFTRAGAKVKLNHAVDGIQALEMLRGSSGTPPLQPDFVLLDLNLPRMDGRELLRALKADPQLRRLPVVVLTSSNHEADIAAMYDLQASCYLVKPIDFTQFLELAKAIDQLWFHFAQRPPWPT